MSLTFEEREALSVLAEAAGRILSLPVCHEADLTETVRDIHNLQNRIMARSAVRAHPGDFHAVEGFE